MARAGFYAIESRKISFGRDGEWYSDGERIENRKIADLFSRSIEEASGGGFELRMGDERAAIEVEDTPYVVRQVHEGDGTLGVALNDGTTEPLDPNSVHLRGEVLYCRVRGGRFTARFLRAAQVAMARWIFPDDEGGWVLDLSGERHAIPTLP